MARTIQVGEQRLFHEHLTELRNRLIWWLLSLIVFSAIALYFQKPLSALVISPLGNTLYYSSPLGGVDFLFKIVLVFGFIPSVPILLYQLLRFTEPALPRALGKILPKIILSSIFLTIVSVVYAYSPTGLPLIFKLLHYFDTPEVQPLINAQEYFSFVMSYLLLIDIFIQLPLALVVVNHIVPIDLKKLNRYQFYILLAVFLLAGLVTPGLDPRPQLVLFLPVAAVFELAVVSIYRTNKKRAQNDPAIIKLHQEADELYKTGCYDESARCYQQLIKLAPNNSIAQAGLGKVYIRQEKFELAAEAMRQAIIYNKKAPSHHANLGIALFGNADYSGAANAFSAALKLRPDNARYRELLNLARKDSI